MSVRYGHSQDERRQAKGEVTDSCVMELKETVHSCEDEIVCVCECKCASALQFVVIICLYIIFKYVFTHIVNK